jgi:hypothetical protein
MNAKYRLRYLCILWHLLVPRSTCHVADATHEDEDFVIFATRISPLMTGSKLEPSLIPDSVEEQSQEMGFLDPIDSENWTQFNDDMTAKQSCKFGGEERLVGYIAMKLKSKFPELLLLSELETRTPQSWTQLTSNGGLHIPSYNFFNLAKRWN